MRFALTLALSLFAGCGPALPAQPPSGSALALDTFEPPPPALGTSFEDREPTPEESGGGHQHHRHGAPPADAGVAPSGGHSHGDH